MLAARLDHSRRWLKHVLPHLNEEMIHWAPREGMRTIGGQLVEIIEVEIVLPFYMKEGRAPNDDEYAKVLASYRFSTESLEELTRILTEVRAATLSCLESFSDDELNESVPSGKQWFGTMWLPEMPRAEHFLNMSEHEFYHVGQLISYLWSRGDDPYQW